MTIDRAKSLRVQSTSPERRLWRLLHPFRTGGYHFRKQVQIGPYFADIACHHAQLIIKVDGDTHGTAAAAKYDSVRDSFLRSRGFQVLRFSNQDVMANPEGVFTIISEVLAGIPSRLRSTTSASN